MLPLHQRLNGHNAKTPEYMPTSHVYPIKGLFICLNLVLAMYLHSRNNKVRKVKSLQYQRVKTHVIFVIWKRNYDICKTVFPKEVLLLRGLLLHVEVAIRDCGVNGSPEFREL